MADYESISNEAVQKLARQGDPDAMFDMMYRTDLAQSTSETEDIAWQDYWQERAANAGHVVARWKSARALIDNPCSSDERKRTNRKKAFDLFLGLVKDFEANKLNEEDRPVGPLAKLELGILYCEGICNTDSSDRNPKEGLRLIKEGEESLKRTGELKIRHFELLGDLYAMGYTQPDELPTRSDVEKSIEYLECTLNHPDAVKMPRDRLKLIGNMLDAQKRRLDAPINREQELQRVRYRKKTWQQSEDVKKAVRDKGQESAIDDALRRLRERLTHKGW